MATYTFEFGTTLHSALSLRPGQYRKMSLEELPASRSLSDHQKTSGHFLKIQSDRGRGTAQFIYELSPLYGVVLLDSETSSESPPIRNDDAQFLPQLTLFLADFFDVEIEDFPHLPLPVTQQEDYDDDLVVSANHVSPNVYEYDDGDSLFGYAKETNGACWFWALGAEFGVNTARKLFHFLLDFYGYEIN